MCVGCSLVVGCYQCAGAEMLFYFFPPQEEAQTKQRGELVQNCKSAREVVSNKLLVSYGLSVQVYSPVLQQCHSYDAAPFKLCKLTKYGLCYDLIKRVNQTFRNILVKIS